MPRTLYPSLTSSQRSLQDGIAAPPLDAGGQPLEILAEAGVPELMLLDAAGFAGASACRSR